ncbi:MAG: SpoIIE family protein phosphatase [Candidatus Riflebacteria bacterium]|nr:SpoIIE family protein phosphatase [Candidatus Riflebacteria bacterium]
MPKKAILTEWLLFLVLPLSLMAWCFNQTVQILREKEQYNLSFRLEHFARSIFANSSEGNFAKQFFSNPWLVSLGGRLELSLPPNVLCASHPELNSLRLFLLGGTTPDDQIVNSWKDLLGWEFQPFFVRSQENRPIPIRWGRGRAWLIWKKVPGKIHKDRSIHLIIFSPPSHFLRLINSLKNSRNMDNIQGTVINLKSGRYFKRPNILKERIASTLSNLGKENKLSLVHPGCISYLETLPNDLALYLEIPLSGKFLIGASPKWLAVIILFLSIITFLFPRLKSFFATLSIKFKLLGVFLYIVALPLFAITILALSYLNDKIKLNTQKFQQAAHEEMMQFDRDFSKEEESSRKLFDQSFDDPDLCSGNFKAFEKKLNNWIASHKVFFFEAWDWNGKKQVTISQSLPDQGFKMMQEMIAKISIKVALGKTKASEFSPKENLVKTFLDSPGIGQVEILRKPGVLHKVRMGISSFYYFWNVRKDDYSKKTAFVIIARSHAQAVYYYLIKEIIKNRLFPIFVRDRHSGNWFPRKPKIADLETLCSATSRTGELQADWFEHGNQRFLGVGMPGFKLEGFDIIALVSEKAILSEPLKIRAYIGFGLLLSVLITLAFAFFLANGFLIPIRDLMDGISLIRSRESQNFIPIRGKDEFGQLAKAFNHILETIDEKKMAKDIQESLIPLSPVVPLGYEIETLNKMSSIIGGDYLDCFPIKNGKTVFLVGDVSGHGTDSALVMAMAKAVVFLHFDEENDEMLLLRNLSRALYHLTLKRQFMSMCFGIIDPVSHNGFLSTAGNPYPFLVKAKENLVQSLGYPGYPLGIKPEQYFDPLYFSLAEGDTLLIYTNGIIEASDSENRIYGYEKLKRVIEENVGISASLLIKTIEQSLVSHLKGRSPTDDVSIMAIQRKILHHSSSESLKGLGE